MSLKPEKFILDATAGFRMMWFNKHEPHTIYLDQRPECEPDIVGDFRDLEEFPDETFRLVVFDPPHFIKQDKHLTTAMVRTFGMLESETWQTDLKLGFKELWRILKPYGILIFKWSNHQISSHEILKIASHEPLFYQISQSKVRATKRTRTSADSGMDRVQTLWFCFMKFPSEEGRQGFGV